MKIDIKVRKKHIKTGLRSSPSYCPVSLAIKEQQAAALPGVLVGTSYVDYADPKVRASRVRTMLPNFVRRRIHKFDTGGGMTPFAFSVEVPD